MSTDTHTQPTGLTRSDISPPDVVPEAGNGTTKSTAAPVSAKKRASQNGPLGLLSMPEPREIHPVSLNEPLLTAVQAADLLNIPRSTIYHLVGTGELPHRYVGRRIRFYKPDLEEYLGRLF